MGTDDTKQLLLKAAQKLFSEKGYEAVSTRELAETAGVNLGAINYHFGSKAKLFVETIHCMMGSGSCIRAAAALEGSPASKSQAATMLCWFICGLLDNMLRVKGPKPFRLIFREVLSDTAKDTEMFEALVSSTVDNYIRPLVEKIVGILKVIRPELKNRELSRIAASIIGQCSFYVTDQPFVERLHSESLEDPAVFNEIALHICRFSLQALQLEVNSIEQIMSQLQNQINNKVNFCTKEKL